MSTLDVARKDFLDVRRAKVIWLIGGLYAAIMALFLYFGQTGVSNPNVRNALGGLTGIGAVFIPLIALVAAYLAIAGERESGGIKYLLSIPNSRRDVVLGKFLSRTAIVAAAIVVAFLVGAVLTLVWYPSLEADVFVGIASLTVLYALTYVAVAIGISATTASRSRAMGGAIGFFFVTNVLNLFGPFRFAIEYLFNDLAGLGISNMQVMFVQVLLSPTAAYVRSTPLAYSADSVSDIYPWFLQPEVMVAVMLAWLVVPIALGCWRFERADLG
ncbi:ABC transporter permease subunit [Natrinema salifodinae]|uniref:ABC-2 type transport system permease protein n=1 Tax=Natrinema salifodinae TaxID=1202768 RepID=A0A1I0PLP6_9EURY|nr:ABC transporter permease subunit [Natrinema salifodinae]SEW14728.1 ABC-2 type transport system permease protein [Natrinema salifodinae]